MKAFFIRCKHRCELAGQGRDSLAMRDLPTPIPGTGRLDRFGLQAGKTHLSDGNVSCDRSSAADETAASCSNGTKSHDRLWARSVTRINQSHFPRPVARWCQT